SQVVDHVLRANVGELQHLVDDHPGRGNVGPGDVVFRLGTLGESRRGGADGERRGKETRGHSSSSLSSKPCSANATDRRRIPSRPPRKCRTALSGARFLRDHAKQTMPTGFFRVPPPGPAIPVTATATCARLRANAPAAISFAVSS